MGRTSDGKAPRLKDVAAVAGVSHQTVSRVVNGHPNVRTGTREKVKAAIAELGYRPNTAARSLVTRRSRRIGVLASELSQYGPANTLMGIEQAARDAGYSVSIAALREVNRASICEAINHFMDQSVDGIAVVVPHEEALAALDDMELSVPVVTVGSPTNSNVSGTIVDQGQGARAAVQHLLQQGHRAIAHLSGPPGWPDSSERKAGWREALRGAGLPDEHLFIGDWGAGSGYTIGRKIAQDPRITAVFVANDQMALGVLRAFAEAEVRVPEDVSVVGFDDQPESAYFIPPLTTVRQDFEELGRHAVDSMLQELDSGMPAGTTVITPALHIRASTAHYQPAPHLSSSHSPNPRPSTVRTLPE
ncbi:LacI family DNA-binding transcriptional regulator [Arthrobacter bambusae]|uniref:LacI family DNA-binding transcriptional regulator n=1 Tax=Arthrobacter bambusae TaxID=1338426 RepID=UPI0027875251|nr:LacI family DNA-binding transcriptional regulator [Arthrobacter bambusae]MDQ0031498.1 DNA-binding LacI/PurR family transcriptional regulator [Arthrobacter bambusae]MDQ0099721.1 DNA-binding LacI/PurR family transcriptional regulator [Arthrobacter bambusae]